ncbi:NAD(P)/FAD-dependent oxidoreductase [Mycobacterium sp. URHB0044]|uniref:NAD(P)/FAD-dependent oxidoreductase n=1 Tax=Mycobacterium sp. URHB0044 TaxID=1380386 RepID=UPI00048AB467|nr:FAD/NAD(P)-binding oxidoreductase [Mycobacterium sp. URHB0044]
MSEHIVVVGASMGGLRAAEQLRAQGFSGQLTVVGAEPHMPYNRPPLSKDVLAQHRDDTNSGIDVWHQAVAFRQRKNTADVTWRLGETVLAADLGARTLTLGDGATLGFDGLVIATGLRPRRLEMPGPRVGRHVIRTLDDAVALRAALRLDTNVVVVGGGFIGCEVAATARSIGCNVHIVEPNSALMVRPLGARLGQSLRRVHEFHGVAVHTGVSIQSLLSRRDAPDRLTGAMLTDGSAVYADVLIESVGSHPNVEWLAGNGIDVTDGVLCDNHMRVDAPAPLVAVGDIARFPDPATGVARRIEHWCIPTETAKRAARTLLTDLAGRPDDTDRFCPLPSFWSDQYDLRIQGYGSPGDADAIQVIEGSLGEPGHEHAEAGTVVGYYRGGRPVGVVMISPTSTQNLHYRNAVDAARSALAPL